MDLDVNVLDIWSSDDEEKGKIDLWKDDNGKAQPVAKIEEKPEGSKSEEIETKKGNQSRKKKKKLKKLKKSKESHKLLLVFESCS